jgi:hypothetical protein
MQLNFILTIHKPTMGFNIEQNWMLKLNEEQCKDIAALESEQIYQFVKEGYRIYPIGIPIDLFTKEWHAVAKVIVTEITQKENKTTGSFTVLKKYTGVEQEIITNSALEMVQIMQSFS